MKTDVCIRHLSHCNKTLASLSPAERIPAFPTLLSRQSHIVATACRCTGRPTSSLRSPDGSFGRPIEVTKCKFKVHRATVMSHLYLRGSGNSMRKHFVVQSSQIVFFFRLDLVEVRSRPRPVCSTFPSGNDLIKAGPITFIIIIIF